MTQQQRNEGARVVVCLFCGTHTVVPFSPARETADYDSGPGIMLVRCHVCRKEAPYGASETFLSPEAPLSTGTLRSRAAGL
jgi:hypothetical protein